MGNLLEISQELGRVDLTKGGIINANLTVSSGVSVAGNVLIKSSLTVSGPVVFDGPVTVSRSSFTMLSQTTAITITGTTPGFCIAGSTVQVVTVSDGPLAVRFSGLVGEDSNVQVYSSYLINGSPRTGRAANKSVTGGYGGANFVFNLSFEEETQSLTAGTHDFCLTIWQSGAGNAYLGGLYDGTHKAASSFGAREAK